LDKKQEPRRRSFKNENEGSEAQISSKENKGVGLLFIFYTNQKKKKKSFGMFGSLSFFIDILKIKC
jgi:hypothetical protein